MKTTNITKYGKTKNNKNILISDCLFPFNYRCKQREKCVHGENGNWCATKLTPRGFTDKWAFCASKNEKKNVSKDLKYINGLVKSKLKTMKSHSKKSEKRLTSNDLKSINRLVKKKLKTMKAPNQHTDNATHHQRGRTLQRHNTNTENRRRSNPPTRQTAKVKGRL